MPLWRRPGCTGRLGHGSPIASSRRCDLRIGANVTVPRARHHRGPRRCTSVSRNVFLAASAPRRACALSTYWAEKNQPIITLPGGGSHRPHICFRVASTAPATERVRRISAGLGKRGLEPTSSALQCTPTSRFVAHSRLMLSITPSSDLPYKVFPPTQTPFWLLNSFIANRLSSFLAPFAAVRPRHGRRAVATRAFGISNVRSLNVSTLQRLLPKALSRRYQHYNRHVSDFCSITATTQRVGGTPDSPSPKPHLTVKIILLTSYFYIFIRKTNPVFAILAASAITPPSRITEAENIWPPK